MWTSSFRYGKEAKQELDFIVSKLGINKSQAITEAIHAFYKLVQEGGSAQKSSAEIFLESGFVGSEQDDVLLSTNYKEQLTKYLNEKHDCQNTDDTR